MGARCHVSELSLETWQKKIGGILRGLEYSMKYGQWTLHPNPAAGNRPEDCLLKPRFAQKTWRPNGTCKTQPEIIQRMPKKNVATMSLNRPAALLSSSDSICASVIAAAWRCPCQGLGGGGGGVGGAG